MTPIKPPSLCPRCREEMRVADWGAGFQAVCLECRWRSCRYPSAEKAETDIAPLAWFEPRDRLPTPAEEEAHLERHGGAAGWMVLQTGGTEVARLHQLHFVPNEAVVLRYYREMVGAGLWVVTVYPALKDGRPVGWPEVKHG